ncbi:hypothetical protein B484DRAFT_452081 [Ochromonadaceae sp. CCMP2298]|nr:hypothetical protein B484DRAFT_452081 [Ochromonadaceae sp. CCMP2298]
MLRSSLARDDYLNVNLSNLKLLSTTRHEAKIEKRLRDIDEVLRDIEGSGLDNAIARIEESEEQQQEQPIEPAPSNVGQRKPNPPASGENTVPILLSIQHNNFRDIVGAVETFLTDYTSIHSVTDMGSSEECSCHHCSSTEIKHAEKLADISTWRKSLMTSLKLKTKTFV